MALNLLPDGNQQPFVPPIWGDQVEINQVAEKIVAKSRQIKINLPKLEIISDMRLRYNAFFWFPLIEKMKDDPAKWQKIFKQSSTATRIIAEQNASYASLEEMYSWSKRKKQIWCSYESMSKMIENENFNEYFWQESVLNAAALRNRLRLVKYLLKNTIDNLKSQPIKILSLASGSAKAVIDTIADYNGHHQFQANFLDASRNALNYSQQLAQNLNQHQLSWQRGFVETFSQKFSDFEPDIVEIVGYLDYPQDDQVVKILSQIKKFLPLNGTLIAGNVQPNQEQWFVHEIVGWKPMQYRTPSYFSKLLLEAGFAPNQIQIFIEPMGIHTIALCRCF